MKNFPTKLAATTVVGTFLGLVFSYPATAANLIVNGSFEDGDFSNVNYNSWVRLSPGSTKLTGWSIGGAGVDWHNTTEMQFPVDGKFLVDLNLDGGDISQTGTLSQTFATIPNQLYTLSFYLSGPTATGWNFPDPRQVRVDIGGVEQIFSTPASPNTSIVWGQQQLTFKAIDAETTLKFSSVNGAGFWGPALDNVSVEKVSSVPEPSNLGGVVLLGVGLLGLRAKQKATKNQTNKSTSLAQ
jgi:choice-of-anchor C domain-containing protein